MNNELTAALATIEKCREITGCPDGVDLQDHLRQLAAENVELKSDRDTLAKYWVDDGGDEECAKSYCEEIPATDRIVAGIKADGVTAALESCSDYLDTDCVMDRLDISYEDAEKRTSGAIEFHDAMVNFANQLREGGK
ncbi:hypothetical protein [Klebsiella michiganensis]|uniref:hypothetical protein n=1 Tax=Klebsiella michiganensis TaxID=1134687 RepID=UPI00227B5F3C|nr:hypothetical protein [Klebsiella michiganensis]MCY3507544.1 hypothetical protein [Klebsiella michiganensis]